MSGPDDGLECLVVEEKELLFWNLELG